MCVLERVKSEWFRGMRVVASPKFISQSGDGRQGRGGEGPRTYCCAAAAVTVDGTGEYG